MEQLREDVAGAGGKACHQERVLRAWLCGLPLDSGAPKGDPARYFPQRLREALPTLKARWDAIASVRSEASGEDDAVRLLVELRDGQTVESVLLPREGLCVSTQVGCAVGCTFCMTGRGGLLRQLGSAEIVAQVVLARARRPVRKVVFMGMGEPSHNLDNVLEAMDWLGTDGGIGHKNLVFSTVGDRRVFERLGQGRVKPALALSLHSTRPGLRARLLPRAARLDPEELVASAQAYARATGYPVQYQWTLLEGVNDSFDEMDGILRLLRGQYAVMNLIAFNPAEGLGYVRPTQNRVHELLRYLNEGGVLAKLRESAGQDIDAGCGQLRARSAGQTA